MIIITGASRGIGAYLTTELSDTYRVFGVSRSISNDYFHCGSVDISNEQDVLAMFKEIEEQGEPVEGLINCAGIASMNSFLLTPVETLDKIYNVNVRGTFLMCKNAAKIMVRQMYGRIINFSTCAVPMALEGELAYVASKGAIEAMSRVMARELAPYHITVNVIAPPPTQTGLISGVPKDKLDRIIERTIAKEYGDMAEILRTAKWMLDSGNQVTGQLVNIGGV